MLAEVGRSRTMMTTSSGLPAVARFITTRPGGEPSAALSLYVNKAAYDGCRPPAGGRPTSPAAGSTSG